MARQPDSPPNRIQEMIDRGLLKRGRTPKPPNIQRPKPTPPPPPKKYS